MFALTDLGRRNILPVTPSTTIPGTPPIDYIAHDPGVESRFEFMPLGCVILTSKDDRVFRRHKWFGLCSQRHLVWRDTLMDDLIALCSSTEK